MTSRFDSEFEKLGDGLPPSTWRNGVRWLGTFTWTRPYHPRSWRNHGPRIGSDARK